MTQNHETCRGKCPKVREQCPKPNSLQLSTFGAVPIARGEVVSNAKYIPEGLIMLSPDYRDPKTGDQFPALIIGVGDDCDNEHIAVVGLARICEMIDALETRLTGAFDLSALQSQITQNAMGIEQNATLLQEKCDEIDALKARIDALENNGNNGGGDTRTDADIIQLICDNAADLITTQPNNTKINILTTGEDGKLSAELDDGDNN